MPVPEHAEKDICEGPNCRKPIFWIMVDGKRIPVNVRRARIYYERQGVWTPTEPGYVSHFLTCPDAGRFSRR